MKRKKFKPFSLIIDNNAPGSKEAIHYIIGSPVGLIPDPANQPEIQISFCPFTGMMFPRLVELPEQIVTLTLTFGKPKKKRKK